MNDSIVILAKLGGRFMLRVIARSAAGRRLHWSGRIAPRVPAHIVVNLNASEPCDSARQMKECVRQTQTVVIQTSASIMVRSFSFKRRMAKITTI